MRIWLIRQCGSAQFARLTEITATRPNAPYGQALRLAAEEYGLKPGVVLTVAAFDASTAASSGVKTANIAALLNRRQHSRPLEPRNALNQLILAGERGDEGLLGSSLAPSVRGALSHLLEKAFRLAHLPLPRLAG